MSSITAPRLRDDVSIRPFETGAPSASYIVAVDGRHFVVSTAVAAVLEATREPGSLETIAGRIAARLGRTFTAAEAEMVLRDRIPSIVFHGDGKTLSGPLICRAPLLSARLLAPLLASTSKLLVPIAVLPLLGLFLFVDAFVAVELWRRGGESLQGASLIGAATLTLLGVGIHELGHLSACRRYRAEHGGIGIGLYWFIPAFYAEVSGAWMLARRERAVVDLAGMYFQCLYLLVLAAVHVLRPSATALMALWWSHFLLLNTLNPVLKYDGYWLLSDLSGSHNLHRRIREIARLCWRTVRGTPGARWPSRRELVLFAGFAVLAFLYFGYVMHFVAQHLAYGASRLALAWSGTNDGARVLWPLARTALGLSLMSALAIAIAVMLARALQGVFVVEPLQQKAASHAAI